MEEWETSKENIQPLRRGRDINALTETIQSSNPAIMEQRQHEFEMELRSYKGEDPLKIWFDYVHWVEQHFPRGGHDGHLIPLVKKCIGTFKENIQYRNDQRFLEICSKLGYSWDPLELYEYLYSQQIGTMLSSFYQDWSWEHEKVGDFHKAIQILALGVQNHAQPMEDLASYQVNFELRMCQHINELRNFSEEDYASQTRISLGRLHSFGKHAPIIRVGPDVQAGPPGATSSASLQLHRQSQIPVFRDENGEQKAFPAGQKELLPLPSKKTNKENSQDPGVWTTVRAPSKEVPKVRLDQVDKHFTHFQVHEDADAILETKDVGEKLDLNGGLTVHQEGDQSPKRLERDLQSSTFPQLPPNQKLMVPKLLFLGARESSLEELRAIHCHSKAQTCIVKTRIEKVQHEGDILGPLPYEDDPQIYGSKDVKFMVAFQKVYPPELLRLLPQECQSLRRGRERSFEEIRAKAYLSGQYMKPSEVEESLPYIPNPDSPNPKRRYMFHREAIYPAEVPPGAAREFLFEELRAEYYLSHAHPRNSCWQAPSIVKQNIVDHHTHDTDMQPGPGMRFMFNVHGSRVKSLPHSRSHVGEFSFEEIRAFDHLYCCCEPVKHSGETRGFENLHHDKERYIVEEEEVIVSKVCRSFTPASSTEKISGMGLSDDEISEKESSTTHHSSSKSPRGDSISGSKTPNATFNCTETTREALKAMSDIWWHNSISSMNTNPSTGIEVSTRIQDDAEEGKTNVQFQIYRDQSICHVEEHVQEVHPKPAIQIHKDPSICDGENENAKESHHVPEIIVHSIAGVALAEPFRIYMDESPKQSFTRQVDNDGENQDRAHPKNDEACWKQWDQENQPLNLLLQEYLDDEEETPFKENEPPREYMPGEKRNPQGILVPAADVPVLPIDEQEAQEIEKNEENEKPEKLYFKEANEEERTGRNFLEDEPTTVIASHPELFKKGLTKAFSKSTPLHNKRRILDEEDAGQEECTMKLFLLPSFKVQGQNDDDDEVNRGEIKENEGLKGSDPPHVLTSNPVKRMSRRFDAAGAFSNLSVIKEVTTSSSSSGFSRTDLAVSSCISPLSAKKPQTPTAEDGPDNQGGMGKSFGQTSRNPALSMGNTKSGYLADGEISVLEPEENLYETFHGEREENIPPQVDPFDSKEIERFLQSIKPPLESRPFVEILPGKISKRIKVNSLVTLGQEKYRIKGCCGEGAYAKVYHAEREDLDDMSDMTIVGLDAEVALKLQTPPCPWEVYICTELHSRLKNLNTDYCMRSGVMKCHQCYMMEDGSILVSKFAPLGTLLTAINAYNSAHKSMPECLVAYFTYELLHIMEQMHSCKILHADVKPDNFLLQSLPHIGSEMGNNQAVFGNKCQSLQLIDFGRSIDMNLFPDGTTFSVSFTKKTFQCIEMRTQRPWTYQLDLYGLAGTIYCMIKGSYMEVTQSSGQWIPMSFTMSRTWKKEFWRNLLITLLNIESCDNLPSLSKLREDLINVMDSSYLMEDMEDATRELAALLAKDS